MENNRPSFKKCDIDALKYLPSIDTIFANEKQIFKKQQQKPQTAVFNAFEYSTFIVFFILLSTPLWERALQYFLHLGIAKAYCNESFQVSK